MPLEAATSVPLPCIAAQQEDGDGSRCVRGLAGPVRRGLAIVRRGGHRRPLQRWGRPIAFIPRMRRSLDGRPWSPIGLVSPDTPGSWRCNYAPYAVDGERAVISGWTEYVAADGTTVERRFYNVWLCAFDAEGRCSDFTEYYMEPRRRAATGTIDQAPAA